MEPNLPVVAKKFWKMVRVLCFMVKKGLSKAKLMTDLSLMMKRSKIAGKSVMHNLIFHHNHIHNHSAASIDLQIPADEYEFSCSDTPTHRTLHLPFHIHKRKSHAPTPSDRDLLAAAMEFVTGSASASPALPGFGQTPVVRQLRITDSPFPVTEIEEDTRVDEAAEEFIMRFYRDLRHQNAKAA